jgi:hypothetical protein
MHEFVGLIELCVTDCSKAGAKKVDDENNFTIRVATFYLCLLKWKVDQFLRVRISPCDLSSLMLFTILHLILVYDSCVLISLCVWISFSMLAY